MNRIEQIKTRINAVENSINFINTVNPSSAFMLFELKKELNDLNIELSQLEAKHLNNK